MSIPITQDESYQGVTDSGISLMGCTDCQENENSSLQCQDEDSEWEDCSDDDDDDYIPLWDEDDNTETEPTKDDNTETEPTEADIDAAELPEGNESSESNHLPEAPTVPGASLVWDNTQWLAQARHQGQNTNKMNLRANALAAEHRVQATYCEDRVIDARDISVDTYVQQEADQGTFYEYAAWEVAKAMVRNIPHFSKYKDVVTWHVPHQHSKEMAVKSKVVRSYWFYIV